MPVTSIIIRSKVKIEEMDNGKKRIIVYEIPYQVNKATMIEKIASLVREKVIDGITYLNDESNRDGVRIVIELRKDVQEYVILNQLYRLTPLGCALWRMLEQPLSEAQAAALLDEAYPHVGRRRIARDVRGLFDALRARGLTVPADDEGEARASGRDMTAAE